MSRHSVTGTISVGITWTIYREGLCKVVSIWRHKLVNGETVWFWST